MLKTNHFECFFNQLIYSVRQLGNVSISQKDVLICQDQQGTNMEVQMSITLALRMTLEPGLIKKQHGSEIPIEMWSHFEQCLNKL